MGAGDVQDNKTEGSAVLGEDYNLSQYALHVQTLTAEVKTTTSNSSQIRFCPPTKKEMFIHTAQKMSPLLPVTAPVTIVLAVTLGCHPPAGPSPY
ncbi:hypothetical protein PoB_000208700 [Plakobranchus ocellatus]|uniref:Uncharacterized protein n=1 Tax=Plakobranchus ocellatus TaxID=259542 RepID=A0AAV3XZJ4_9GAST|nr:hypothetical protein PoB_000208700 [Plakobranchus ocellatus]